MGRELRHETVIGAPPSVVWAVLTETERYREWNPFLASVEGDLVEGARLTVRITPPGGRPITFKPVVTTVRPERELRWLGHLVLPGIFDGEHWFELHPLPDGATRLVHAERFGGLIVPLLGTALARTEQGFRELDAALKARAEERA